MALLSCPECKNSVSDKASTCPKCGYPIQTYINKSLPNNSKPDDYFNQVSSYSKKSTNVMLEQPTTSKANDKLKLLLVAFLIVLGFFGYVLIFRKGNSETSGKKETPPNSENNANLTSGVQENLNSTTTAPVTKEDSLLKKAMNITDEQEAEIIQIFNNCDIKEIVSVEQFRKIDTSTSYHIRDVETNRFKGMAGTIVVYIDNQTGKLRDIYFNDNDIYVDGSMVSKVSDWYISDDDFQKYRVLTQQYLAMMLQNPDSAEYPARSGWSSGVIDGLDCLSSTVTVENIYGGHQQLSFVAKFLRQNKSIKSLTIDGVEMLK